MHEQSETVERKSGAYNVYGGTQFPLPKTFGFEQKQYNSVVDAVKAAKRRSQLGGAHEIPSSSAPQYGIQPQNYRPGPLWGMGVNDTTQR